MTNSYYERYEEMNYTELRTVEDEFCADPSNAFWCRACPIAYKRGWDDRFSEYGCTYGWCEVAGAVPKEQRCLRHRKRRNNH